MCPDQVLPDIGRIDLDEAEEGVFPGDLTSEYRVVIQQQAFTTIEAHAATDTSVELCGVLAGRLLRDTAGPFLVVEQAIPGEASRRTSSRVTFTHETWDHIHGEMESRWPELRIVGWYHTHPGFGIFLSDMDQFIQDNFFNLPHQVAFVFDPLSGEQGLFVWEDGRSARLGRYWLGDTLLYDHGVVDPVPAVGGPCLDREPEEVSGSSNGLEPSRAESRWSIVLWYCTGVAALLAAFWLGGWTARATSERSQQRIEAADSLLRTGLLLDGLSDDLTRVADRLDRAYAELHPAADADASTLDVDGVREAIKESHRELVRMRRSYGEGERLVRALVQRLAPTSRATSTAGGEGPAASPSPAAPDHGE